MRAAVAAALVIAAASAPDGAVPQVERAALSALTEPAFNAQDFVFLDDCGASERQHLIGEPFSETQRVALPPNTRVIRRDMANTLDLRPKRTNVILDENEVIAAIGCY